MPEPLPPSPERSPLASGLAELAGWWPDVACACNRGLRMLPLRLLAGRLGWRVPLSAVLLRLRCKACGGPPGSVVLTDDPTSATGTPGKGCEIARNSAPLRGGFRVRS